MAEDEDKGKGTEPVEEQPEAGQAPADASPAEAPKEPTPEAPAGTPAEEPKEEAPAPPEASVEPPAEAPAEAPKEEAPAESSDAPEKAPVEAPTEALAEAPAEVPTEAPTEVPSEQPKVEAPTEAEGPKAEAEDKPKKKSSKRSRKAKAEAEPEVAEGEVLIETVDEKTDRKVTYTIKPLFGKYPFTGVVVTNPGLQRYVNISPVSVPHTGARHANRPFAKQHVNIVERLINGMMRNEWGTGEKAKMYRVVEEAFDIIHNRTKQNPIQVFVDALSNSAPKEEVTRLRYGGINVPKAVDVSASRRLDIALRNICHGAIQSSHNSKKRLQQCLADEIILASKREINSFAIAKKEELERIAASAR